ncbi:MAG: Internalin-A precursor [Candidatus Heimdallarchaeota archaeon LC_3]|nr:MAG: Internalin-A precursor [Candidatus Heimdallarchaeota archaeon LC_3]
MPKYNSITLTNQDYNVIKSLEEKISEPIPFINQGSHGDHIKYNSFGFIPLNSFINSLGLFNKKINEFSLEITDLGNLRHLSLGRTGISNVGSNIGLLVNLEKIYFSYNKLKTLPGELFTLSELAILDLSNNRLKSLPDNLDNLTSLRRLLLSNNDLKSLPENVYKLKNLQKLDLSNNKLNTLPETVLNLKNLKYLNITNNIFDIDWIESFKSKISQTKFKAKIIW